MKTFLSIGEVADELGIDAANVRQRIREGRLRAVDVSRKQGSRKPRYRVRSEDLETFLAGRETSAPAKRERPRKAKDEDVIDFVAMMKAKRKTPVA